MTFEEFFVKKKIDLDALAKADPELFSEFKSHYNLMGEKSFDHTKKFLFNRLRHLYHLSTTDKALTQFDTKIASQAEPLSSPTIEQRPAPSTESAEPLKPVVKPGFRPKNIPLKAEEKKEGSTEVEGSAAGPAKKPGFKPRNIKAADKNPEESNSMDSSSEKTEASEPTKISPPPAESDSSKSAYKPRFKPRNIPANTGSPVEPMLESKDEKIIENPSPDSTSVAEVKAEDSQQPAKPAYKPRFQMKNLPGQKATKEGSVEAPEEKVKSSLDVAASEDTPAGNDNGESPVKPTYKPRFNPKNLPKVKAAGEVSSEQEPSGQNKVEELSSESKPEINEPLSPEKPAYKPRFNMKNIKPKPPEATD